MVSASDGDLDLGLPDADRLDQDDVAAGGVQHPQRLRRGAGQPAEVAARGHRADEHAGVGGVVLHAHAVAEQRAAGERRRRVDGQHADPLARARAARDERGVGVDLPTPGEPVSPTTWACPACGASAAATSRSCGRVVLDQRDEPRDGARRRPLAGAASTEARGDGRRLAARPAGQADGTRRIRASPWPPPPHSAAAPTPPPRRLQLEREVQREPGAGHADRVAERDGAAVDVDAVLGRRRARVIDCSADRRERLVDLDQVEVGDGRCPPCAARR